MGQKQGTVKSMARLTAEHDWRTGAAWLRIMSACTWPIRSYTSGTTSLRPSTACHRTAAALGSKHTDIGADSALLGLETRPMLHFYVVRDVRVPLQDLQSRIRVGLKSRQRA